MLEKLYMSLYNWLKSWYYNVQNNQNSGYSFKPIPLAWSYYDC